MRSTAVPFAAFARSLALSLATAAVAAVTGCGGAEAELGNDDVTTERIASALLPATSAACDADAVAGGGWVSTAMPTASGSFSVLLHVTPEISADAYPPVLDAVVGLSNGAATHHEDLGPALRFSTNGTIDVRNGPTYASDRAFPYTPGYGPYEIRFDVDVPSHTYSVWARHLDQLGKPMEKIATSYAFGTEQRGVALLDSLNRYVGGTQGGVQTCGFAFMGPRTRHERALFLHPVVSARAARYQRQ